MKQADRVLLDELRRHCDLERLEGRSNPSAIARAEQVRGKRSDPSPREASEANVPAYAIGAHAVIGRRPAMEDRHVVSQHAGGCLAAVMDGHGGAAAADAVADGLPDSFFRGLDAGLDAAQAFRRAFADLDAAIRSPECGTTVAACYLRERVLTVAHVGDSRLVLAGPREARALTRDHRVDDPAERRRIRAAGGRIEGPYVVRGGRGLMVTRALGDTALRAAGVIPQPDIATRRITMPGTHLLIATDGIWDVLDVSMAARLTREAPDPSAAARAVIEAASRAGSRDNLTAVVIAVPQPRPVSTRERRADRGL